MITFNLKLHPDAGVTEIELEALSQQWQQTMLEAGVDSIQAVQVPAPAGARPLDLLALAGEFMVNFSAGVAATFVFALWSWLKESNNTMTKIEFWHGQNRFVIMSNMAEAEVQRLARQVADMVQPPSNPTA